MIFDDWIGIGRVLLVGTLAYFALVVLLRATGKRTLSKLNAFDLIVTVALGSTLATVLLTQDVALAEGVTAFALLVGLQWIITWLSVRSPTVAGIVKAEPALLYFDGRFLRDAMRRERFTEAEVRSAMRQQGVTCSDLVRAVVLETDGSLNALIRATPGGGPMNSLEGVQGPGPTIAGNPS